MTMGAAVMFGFGIVWLLIGLLRGRRTPAGIWISLLVVGIALGASITVLFTRAAGIPRDAIPLSEQQIAVNHEIAWHFYVIFGVELAAIFVAVVVLKAIHYADYILCGIALIVGVHFIPLAALFRAPMYYVTGFLGCVIGLVGFWVADSGLRQKVVGISFGLLLWETAALITWLGLSASRFVGRLPPM